MIGARPAACGWRSGALLALALLSLALPACKQQDAALRVTITGPPGQQFRVPADADLLRIDVLENRNQIATASYPLAPPTAFPVTVVLVQSGAAHPTVKINCTLSKTDYGVTGRGTLDAASFADGQTVDVTVEVAHQN